ncbi:MAG: FAD binding domain-containing protein [Candidatus Izimaplasma sp.]|nr:FAD binding domain-containing protein [Candidatus Izimaplasma bacterium]
METNQFIEVNSLEEAYILASADRLNKVIGGGAWLKISLKKAKTLISLDKLNLDFIDSESSFIEIGAQATLREIETNKDIKKLSSGILNQAIGKIMGVTIRNLATIGGSVMGKFAFSDLYPVLLVMDVKLKFYKLGEISFADFVEMPRINDDILISIKINKNNSVGYFKKAAKTALDFAMINLAITKGDDFKIAIGSKPSIAKLNYEAMKYLNSKKDITEEVIEKTCALAIEEAKIKDNVRATKEYREVLIRSYLKRGIKQVIQ